MKADPTYRVHATFPSGRVTTFGDLARSEVTAVEAMAHEELGDMADITVERVELPAPAEPSLLVDYPEAARLLGTTPGALRVRVSAGAIPSRCIRRTGRRVQFVREQLIRWVGGAR
jgi:hypothetical protein